MYGQNNPLSYQGYYYPQQNLNNTPNYSNMYPQTQGIPNRYVMQPTSNIEYVNGIEGVKSLALAPNSIHLVLDSDSKCFYIKRTDMEGRPSIEVHPYTDLETPQKPVDPKLAYVTVEQFNELKKEIELLKSNSEVKTNAEHL